MVSAILISKKMQNSEKIDKIGVHILVGFSGSVATIKDLEVIQELQKMDEVSEIIAVYTKSAEHFRNEER